MTRSNVSFLRIGVYSLDVEVCFVSLQLTLPHEENYLLAVRTYGAFVFGRCTLSCIVNTLMFSMGRV